MSFESTSDLSRTVQRSVSFLGTNEDNKLTVLLAPQPGHRAYQLFHLRDASVFTVGGLTGYSVAASVTNCP